MVKIRGVALQAHCMIATSTLLSWRIINSKLGQCLSLRVSVWGVSKVYRFCVPKPALNLNISGASCVMPRVKIRVSDIILGLRVSDIILGLRVSVVRVRVNTAFSFREVSGQTVSVSVTKTDIEYQYLMRSVSDF